MQDSRFDIELKDKKVSVRIHDRTYEGRIDKDPTNFHCITLKGVTIKSHDPDKNKERYAEVVLIPWNILTYPIEINND